MLWRWDLNITCICATGNSVLQTFSISIGPCWPQCMLQTIPLLHAKPCCFCIMQLHVLPCMPPKRPLSAEASHICTGRYAAPFQLDTNFQPSAMCHPLHGASNVNLFMGLMMRTVQARGSPASQVLCTAGQSRLEYCSLPQSAKHCSGVLLELTLLWDQ